MKYSVALVLILSLTLFHPSAGRADDMRKLNRAHQLKKQVLLEKARKEEAQAKAEAAAAREKLRTDKKGMEAALAQLRKKKQDLQEETVALRQKFKNLNAEHEALRKNLNNAESRIKEINDVYQIGAKKLKALSARNFQQALNPSISHKMPENARTTAMAPIRRIVDALLKISENSGEVRITPGNIVDRTGKEVAADLLVLGSFTAAYRTDKEMGYLLFSETSGRLFALSKLPPARVRRQLKSYFTGKSDAVPMDISGGEALRQMAHRTSFWEQLRNGGPIVWPILGIFILALLIIAERIRYLLKNHQNADKLMERLRQRVERSDWSGCMNICESLKKKPLSRVIHAGIKARNMAKADMENILQETILSEIPALERFLSTLAVLAAVAPLLGLLGTVTGMINTFHAITFFGTGDPRTMSGGISEALTTTMLGLAAAIPIMLAHTLLNRRVEGVIAQMEEKAVALINMIHTGHKGGRP